MSEPIDYYKRIPKKFNKKYHNPGFKKHGIKIPFRGLIIGGCGAGKTNLLLDIITKMNGTFNNIVICCKSKNEPLYEYLAEKCPSIVFREGIDEIPEMEEFEDAGQSLIVFDDLVLEKDQKKIAEYYIRARKIGDGISCIYLTQNFYKTPKTIRVNCNYIFSKKLSSKKDLSMILDEFSLELDLDTMKQLYTNFTKKKTDFFMIDIENSDLEHKYRHNYSPVILGNYGIFPEI